MGVLGGAALVVALLFVVGGAAALTVLGGRSEDELVIATGTMQSQILRQAAIVDTGTPDSVVRFNNLSRTFDVELADGLSLARKGSPERALFVAQSDVADRWRVAALRALLTPATDRRSAAVAGRLLGRFDQDNATLRDLLLSAQAAADRRDRRTLLLAALAFAVLAAVVGGVAAARRWRRRAAGADHDRALLAEDRRHRLEQEEFIRALQGARTEREAQRMLKRQLERALAGSSATVLNRNNSADRLEAVTAIPASSPLAQAIPDAEPYDCLAVRFGQRQERAAGGAPLLACELCGGLEGSLTCVPSLVGGEVIGSVLVETPEPLDDEGHRRLADGVSHAAPVLASMRNLRLSETRAATDTLTGLPNRRAAEDTLKLMLANADRGDTPCAVALFDLDHFKKVNDVYGHEKGDHLLAAVGDVAGSVVRASDFVARFGGEEFLVVLPNTDLDGALTACEKLRAGISDLRLFGVGQSPSASFGVAVFPDDGGEPEGLLRGADRALYAAKSSGRNCVKALRTLEGELEAAALAEESQLGEVVGDERREAAQLLS